MPKKAEELQGSEGKGKTKSKGKRKSKKGLNILNGADSMGGLAASMIKENPAVAEKVEHY